MQADVALAVNERAGGLASKRSCLRFRENDAFVCDLQKQCIER